MEIEKFYTPEYAAERLGISKKTLFRYLDRFKIHHVHFTLRSIRIPESGIVQLETRLRRGVKSEPALTYEEAALRLGVSVKTISRKIKKLKLNMLRITRKTVKIPLSEFVKIPRPRRRKVAKNKNDVAGISSQRR